MVRIARRPAHSRIAAAAVLVIIIGPIAESAWQVRGGSLRALPSASAAAAYAVRRKAAVDMLLPDGAGGTRFVGELNGNAGVTLPGAAMIGVVVTEASLAETEAVELHERAHLVDAALPEAVNALLARLGPAARGSYAATKPSEHFAEMAASAWTVLVDPRGMCSAETPAERLAAAEAVVPGTAGFVA